MKTILKYVLDLSKGFCIMLVLLTWNLQNVEGHWQIPITWFTTWIFMSWLFLYPVLRKAYSFLYSKDAVELESYKTRSINMHHQDMANSHKDHRWTPNGVSVNPWEYTQSNTQSTDEISNPIYFLCEHLWITFILILLGPIVFLCRIIVNLCRNLTSKH